ncbi:hypothetical protein EDF81_4778 [Enterobacter sp. BIGb0383]|nr:hypothetical protein EDF81_4778 [Enterobacter sp. BIGb0383]ROS00378.1 hypothetical protein EC848_4788 [Enterobacter sp. BIGb0359]
MPVIIRKNTIDCRFPGKASRNHRTEDTFCAPVMALNLTRSRIFIPYCVNLHRFCLPERKM